jgi:hypothetical protein
MSLVEARFIFAAVIARLASSRPDFSKQQTAGYT